MRLYFICFLLAYSISSLAQARDSLPPRIAPNEPPAAVQNLEIIPRLGETIDLGLPFFDETGKIVSLKKYFDGRRPVLLVMSYYGCPMLCGLILNAVRDSLAGLDWLPGENFQILAISFDPKEKYTLAAAKKQSIIASVENTQWQTAAAKGWHFLADTNASAQKLAGQIGFRYRWVEEEKQFAHGAAIFLLSPEGKLTRTIFGIDYAPRDLKLGLLEASAGKVGSVAEKILLFCYHYDPKENKYALLATRLMKLGGALTLVVVGGIYASLVWRKRRRKTE